MSRVVDCVGWSDGYVGRVGRLVGRIRRLGEKGGRVSSSRERRAVG